MKHLFLLVALSLLSQVTGNGFAMKPCHTALGYGKFVDMDSVGPVGPARLQVCDAEIALRAVIRKSVILGESICVISWIDGHIDEKTTPGFDTCDSCFQKIRSAILADPQKYACRQVTLINETLHPIGRAIFIGPHFRGIVDPNMKLQGLSDADRTF